MSQLLSRKNFMINLCKRGIPARYAWRVSKELNDHATDMADHQSEAELGDPAILLNNFEAAYKQRTFGGRHPLLTFLMFPLPIVALIYALTISTPILIVMLLGYITDYFSYAIEDYYYLIPVINYGIFTFLVLVPTIISTTIIYRWARKSAIKPLLAVLSCLPIFLIAFAFQSLVLAPNSFNVAFGYGYSTPNLLRQLLQTTIPALVIFYLIHHEKVKQRRLTEKLIIGD